MPPVRDANDVPPTLDATAEANVDAAIDAAARVRKALGEAEEAKETLTNMMGQLDEQALGANAKWMAVKKAKSLLQQAEQQMPAAEVAREQADSHRLALAAAPAANALVVFAKRMADEAVEQAIADNNSVHRSINEVRVRYTALMDKLIR